MKTCQKEQKTLAFPGGVWYNERVFRWLIFELSIRSCVIRPNATLTNLIFHNQKVIFSTDLDEFQEASVETSNLDNRQTIL